MAKLSPELEKFLHNAMHEGEKLIGTTVADRDTDGSFKEIVIAFSDKRLMFWFGDETKFKMFRGFVNKSKLKEPEITHNYESYTLREFDISKTENIEIKYLVAAGLLAVTVDGEQIAVCCFTNSKSRDVGAFVRRFNTYKETGEDKPDDREERREACPKCGALFPEGREFCPKCNKRGGIVKRLLKMSLKYKWSLAAVYIFMLLSSLVGLITPFLTGKVLYDNVLGNNPLTKILFFDNLNINLHGKVLLVIGLIMLCTVLQKVFDIMSGIINVKFSAKVVYDIKTQVFGSMQRLSLSFFLGKQTGNLMNRVNSDASQLHYFFVDGLSFLFTNFITIIGLLVVLLFMNWKLALICLIPVFFLIFYVRGLFRSLDILSWRKWKKSSSLNSAISDTVKGTRVIKAFGKEKLEVERFGKINNSFFTAETNFNKSLATIIPINSLIINSGALLIWAIGGADILSGALSYGVLVTFINYLGMFYGPIQHMSNIVRWWSGCMTSAQRIFEVMDARADVKAPENPVHKPTFDGDILLDKISFGYEPNKYVIKNVDVDIKRNTMVGVVGHSGAGKSTLVNLISRLYDVNEGRILIDGIDVKEIDSDDLRRNIGIVSQEVYVFMGTIAENIAYAKPDCTVEELINAAKIANAHDFIEKLPDGYDTMVGTGGQDLSGGEKQRISIARAILQNPRILILDEATASLDTETERQIQEALESLIEGRTTIAIAHRLSTLRNADFIVVMNDGEIVEQGEHGELIRQKGEYFRQVQKQTEALKVQGVS